MPYFVTARLGQAFPRGWKDFVLQLGIWFGFLFAYQIARGVADRSVEEAFVNGRLIIDFERHLHALVELDIQNVVLRAGDWIVQAVELDVLELAVHGRRPGASLGVLQAKRRRSCACGTSCCSRTCWRSPASSLVPTAPPRLFAEWGFVDTLAQSAALNHGSGFIQLASNPYAAMPSIHSADALILGFAMAALVSSGWAKLLWTLWPSWVWFTVMATGNHFWLDVAGGIGLALVSTSIVVGLETARRRAVLDRLFAR